MVQLQYTPVTGPVWTEPVAAKLAWLPSGRQPARALPPHRLGWYCRPEFAALYQPQGLQWVAPDARVIRTPRAVRDWTVLAELPPAPAYDPQRLEWRSQDGYFGRILPRARLDWTVLGQLPPAPAYDPQRLEWQAEDGYFGRALPRSRLDWTVLQRPIAVAVFDPTTLEWLPRGTYPQVPLERRRIGAFAQPPFEALYRPERMQWLLSGLQPQRALPGILRGLWVSDPTLAPSQVVVEIVRMELALAGRTTTLVLEGRDVGLALSGRSIDLGLVN